MTQRGEQAVARKRMRCIKCGEHLRRKSAQKLTANYRGMKLPVTVKANRCSGCGRVALIGKAIKDYHDAVDAAYAAVQP